MSKKSGKNKKTGKSAAGESPTAEASAAQPDASAVAKNETLKSGESFWKSAGRFQPLR